jgi:hypothetical protein
MGQLIRFGRRVPLPSTVQIVHELLVMERNENARQPKGAEQVKSTTDSETGTTNAALRVPPQGQG